MSESHRQAAPAAKEDAVAVWLQRLSERQEPTRPVTGPIETPAAPTLTGPISLTPLPTDDDADSDPNSEPYFAETLRMIRRAVEPKAEKSRDLFRVLTRNTDCYLQFTAAASHTSIRACGRRTGRPSRSSRGC
jgi:hypothetical protein